MKISRNNNCSIGLQAKTDGTNLSKSCSGLTLKRVEKRLSAWFSMVLQALDAPALDHGALCRLFIHMLKGLFKMYIMSI